MSDFHGKDLRNTSVNSPLDSNPIATVEKSQNNGIEVKKGTD